MNLQQIEKDLKRHAKRNWADLDFDFEYDDDALNVYVGPLQITANNTDYNFTFLMCFAENLPIVMVKAIFEDTFDRTEDAMEALNTFNFDSILTAAVSSDDDLFLNYTFYVVDEDDVPAPLLLDAFINDFLMDDVVQESLEPVLAYLY